MSFAIVTVIVLALDQLLKFWVTKNIPLEAVGAECVELIPGVIHLTNYHNYGAAFGILQNARWLLAGVALVFVIAVIVLISQEIISGRLGQWAAVLVMAGALGNALDRVLYGYVIDMFELEFMTFAVFNVADMFITVAGVLLCLYIIFHKESAEEREARSGGFRVRAAHGRREDDDEEQAPVMRSTARSQSAYDAVPRRGEHKSLEEEFAPVDPDNPFGAWEYDGEDDLLPEDDELPTYDGLPTDGESAEDGDTPDGADEVPAGEAAAASTDWTALFDEFLPAAAPSASGPAASAVSDDDGAKVPPDEYLGEELPGFSIEDILAEFGDG